MDDIRRELGAIRETIGEIKAVGHSAHKRIDGIDQFTASKLEKIENKIDAVVEWMNHSKGKQIGMSMVIGGGSAVLGTLMTLFLGK